MTEDLEARLRAADPARAVVDSSVDRDLLEALMHDTATSTESRTDSLPAPHRRRWLPALAAAALVAAVGVGGYAALSPDEAPPAAAPTVTELALPGSDTMASCVMYDVEFLRPMPVAFSGTAVEVGDGSVLLDVDRWYRGGDSDQVRLVAPGQEMVALLGSVTFEEGGRYLVTATDGVVNSCGFSAEWSPQMAEDFEQAFGSS